MIPYMKTNKARWLALILLTMILLLGAYLRNESISKTMVIHPIRADAREYIAYAYNLRFKHTFSNDIASIRHPEQSVKPDARRTQNLNKVNHLNIQTNSINKNTITDLAHIFFIVNKTPFNFLITFTS